jgi:glycosyltransferase involved in cell wall biosynthesis
MNAATDLVVEGVNGIKSGLKADDMAENIIKSLENSGKCKEKCIELSRKYDWDKIVDSLEKVYNDTVEI